MLDEAGQYNTHRKKISLFYLKLELLIKGIGRNQTPPRLCL